MKAPEKIYLQQNTTTDCYEEFYPEWFEARARKSDIEYIRTNAFINKACEWLEENADLYVGHYLNDDDTYMDEAFITDFKQAMEEQQ